jgi:hypothetical protein
MVFQRIIAYMQIFFYELVEIGISFKEMRNEKLEFAIHEGLHLPQNCG